MSDLISRIEVENVLHNNLHALIDTDQLYQLYRDINRLPTYSDEKKEKGRWKKTYLDHVGMGVRPSILYCSVCHQCIAYPTNYCPNCGADMRAESEDK